MGLYASTHPGVKRMRGLHLFHFFLSNCSQRVRMGLAEKGLAWESHHLSLPANEHVTPEYQRINPKGVVPTLVHNGQVVIESNDILEYLDEHFPEPALRPAAPAARERMNTHIAAAGAIQPAIKALSHDLLFRNFRVVSDSELELYERHHRDRSLVEFLQDYATNGDAWHARVRKAHHEMQSILDDLEAALGEAPWLSGDAFGLADVSWSVNAHRLVQASFPLDRWPRFRAWGERVTARPTFIHAIEWRP